MACNASQWTQIGSSEDGSALLRCVDYASPLEKMSGLLGVEGALDSGNTAWLLVASAFVMLMTPGLAFFDAGLCGEATAVNTLMMSMVSMAIVTTQWMLFGYSLSFGPGNAFIGSLEWALFRKVGAAPSGAYGIGIPNIVFAMFQCMFAQITPALISGSVVGRMKFSSFCVFVLLWTTLVYDPIAHWVWAFNINSDFGVFAEGWLGALGAIDFAGGTVIHISSGFSALAAVFVLGKRHNADAKVRPHNVPLVVLGTSLLWFGWFGFNAASATAANGISAFAFANTHIATALGFLTWMAVEYAVDRTVSAAGACAGAVAALVAVTPGCGFITPWAATFFGIVPALFCFAAARLKHRVGFDDTLDAFCVHGVGGVVGALLTGALATTEVNAFAGALYGNPALILYQLAAIAASAAYAFVVTVLIMLVLKATVGVRVSEDEEKQGLDSSLHGGEPYSTAAVGVDLNTRGAILKGLYDGPGTA